MSRPLDETVTEFLDRRPTAHDEDEDDDELFRELEEDPGPAALREKRAQEIADALKTVKQQRADGAGTYLDVPDEETIMRIITNTPNAVVHFYKSDFRRCHILNSHLSYLAPLHTECRFLKIDVLKAPFLVEKLGIRELPCLVAYVDGKQTLKMKGFGLVGNSDNFRTVYLEELLLQQGAVFERVKCTEDDGPGGGDERGEREQRKGAIRDKKREEDDDDDWD
ncbi:thioredoxin-like protein [Pyronema omphalodes]|nr:thioredoxin-like protein [Pyronema omphalodes]